MAATVLGWTPHPAAVRRPGKAESCTGTALPHVAGRGLAHEAGLVLQSNVGHASSAPEHVWSTLLLDVPAAGRACQRPRPPTRSGSSQEPDQFYHYWLG